jgi:hypothetical protein
MNPKQLGRRIETIKRCLAALGPIHPGSLSAQYNVCGRAGCRCKAPQRPRKHGPYTQLSYTWRGRSTTRFVRAPQVRALRAKLTNYRRFRALVNAWVDLAIALEEWERRAAERGE